MITLSLELLLVFFVVCICFVGKSIRVFFAKWKSWGSTSCLLVLSLDEDIQISDKWGNFF